MKTISIIRCNECLVEAKNQIWNTLYIFIKSMFVSFFDHYLYLSFNPLMCLSYLKVICARPWGPNETIGDLRTPKTSL